MSDYSARGFTLIELLVVLAILSIIAMTLVSSFFALLGGTNKAQITSEVKQNGDYAIAVMTQTIRNARPTPVCNFPPLSVTVTNPDMSQTTFACIDVGSSTSSITAGSPDNPSNNLPLTNNRVRLTRCSFDCLSSAPVNPSGVTIRFILEQNLPFITPITPRAQELSRQIFETTVFQRSYQ